MHGKRNIYVAFEKKDISDYIEKERHILHLKKKERNSDCMEKERRMLHLNKRYIRLHGKRNTYFAFEKKNISDCIEKGKTYFTYKYF